MAANDKRAGPGSRPPGRPRRYEPDDERDRILAATLHVLKRSDGQEASVADILRESGLSTRAFYRHFQTKEDVIRVLYQRDAESFGTHLRRRVEAAGDPEGRLAIWVYEMLGLAYNRRRAERVAALGSPMVLRVVAGTRAEQLGLELLVEPLREVLEKGRADGSFPHARPELDTRTLRAVAGEATSWAQTGVVRVSRQEAADYIVGLSLAALRSG